METESEFLPDGAICETYRFSNPTVRTAFVNDGDIGIAVPFNDDYLNARECSFSRKTIPVEH